LPFINFNKEKKDKNLIIQVIEKNKSNSKDDDNKSIIDKIKIKYKINKNNIKIFGASFVKTNKKNCNIIFENKESELKGDFEIPDHDLNKEVLEIELKGISKITNMKDIFAQCSTLISLSDDFSKLDTKKITNMSFLFSNCTSLTSLPDISKWDTSNVTDMNFMFSGCSFLQKLPDISKWNISNVKDISFMFNECPSLLSLPDISNWDTSNVTNISYLFNCCKSLSSIPAISIWKTSNIYDMSFLFNGCLSLAFIPDITKWDVNNVIKNEFMFSFCYSISKVPKIFNLNKMNDIQIYSFIGTMNLNKNVFKLDCINDVNYNK
jgi:surface protein